MEHNKIELGNYSEFFLDEKSFFKIHNSNNSIHKKDAYFSENMSSLEMGNKRKTIFYLESDGINNKAIPETHPYRPLRGVIPISFFEITEDRDLQILSIDKIIDNYRNTILNYYNMFPEIKAFPKIHDLESKINVWISQINTPLPKIDKPFIKFLKEEILNDEKLSFEEKDCERIIVPAYILLTELYNETYNSLKDLYGIKYYESLRVSIQEFKNLR
jgi:hypothetical protein